MYPGVAPGILLLKRLKFPADSRFLREHRLSQKQSDCGCGSISELIGVIRA